MTPSPKLPRLRDADNWITPAEPPTPVPNEAFDLAALNVTDWAWERSGIDLRETTR